MIYQLTHPLSPYVFILKLRLLSKRSVYRIKKTYHNCRKVFRSIKGLRLTTKDIGGKYELEIVFDHYSTFPIASYFSIQLLGISQKNEKYFFFQVLSGTLTFIV